MTMAILIINDKVIWALIIMWLVNEQFLIKPVARHVGIKKVPHF